MFDFGILSINDRNLNYIKKLNPKLSINLVDNKVETKIFLEERGVCVPKTFFIISNQKELSNFNFDLLKQDFFVIKPVYGSRGRGILIVENLKNGKYKIGNEIFLKEFLIDHMLDILNGDFSLNYGHDKVLIEEKLVSGNGFERFCEYGLADIRIIVYNLVPVAAMIRMPTKSSEGKANLHAGGIGLGIEVGSGIVNTLYLDGKVFQKDFPDNYKNLEKFNIPFWDEILLASSKAQFFVNLGYLALDWVITDSGPKILEINARAGLEIQNVCLLPLKNRLNKIKDLKIQEPEKGVELSKSLFSKKVSHKQISSKVIYLSQNAKINFLENSQDILLKVDINNQKNFISKNLFDIIKGLDFNIEIVGEDIIFANLDFEINKDLENNIFVLGQNSLKDFLIKAENKITKDVLLIPKKANKNEIDLLKIIDDKISKLDKSVSLTYLKPVNFLLELNNFINLKGNYNPIFEYDYLSEKKFDEIKNEIISLKEKYFKKGFELKSEFAKLFLEKIEEIANKLELLQAYKTKNFENIDKYNKKLFGEISKNLFEESEKKLGILANYDVLGSLLQPIEVVKYIQNYLDKSKIFSKIKVVLSSGNISRISVSRKKQKIEVKVAIDGIFREKELDGIIAHEIGTHLLRYLNGQKTGWNILESGTANYLPDEEGLAVYNSLKYFPESYEKNAMYKNYYLIEKSKELNFKELAQIGFRLNGNDYVKVFKSITRLKRGIIDTSIKNTGAYFSKDKVYLDGYTKVKKWIENGGDLEKLMIGKIKIEDLDLI
ncbi:MAG: DUF1704 domain-containing protein [Candidatus Gracilibacteria bacterium]|nr:DUF1704 domain-containing protein [Candidatus Gracilibacteria bacterium]